MQGVFEINSDDFISKEYDIGSILEDNIAKTCLNILVSLVNQNMKVVSKNRKVQDTINQFNKDIKIKRKMDSIIFNQLSYGNSVFFYDVVDPRMMVYDSSTYELVIDPKIDKFEGIYQRTTYDDPKALKEGRKELKKWEEFIDQENLIIVPGIGRGYGESILLPAQPYVHAKTELVNSLYELVRRLGLLTVVGVDLPGDVSDNQLDDYLDEVQEMVEQAKANSTWILPRDCTVEGVKGSGEARIIESVKMIIDMLDEETRKCLFVPDTFLSSLSANRATAKEQRYLISSMVSHIRDLNEESLTEMYDLLLTHHGLQNDYEFTWGNINLPEPETLFSIMKDLIEMDVMTEDEVRGYINLGNMPPELIKKIKDKEKKQDIYTMMGVNQQNEGQNDRSVQSQQSAN